MAEERKLVTVLFADVIGSTVLGDALDPEDVRALMGRYYEHARQVIAVHGGTLEKFIGDAVMAAFGLPHAHGDDAERAVAAALGLQEALTRDPVLASLTLRMGINSGEVVAVSDTASGDFLVTGDAVNVAARLQQAAGPGEILVSERTQRAGTAAFHFGAPRVVVAKGKPEPLTAFPVIGLRPTRHVSRPPFVGRQRELAHLELLQAWALEEHRPQLVSIVAPAGIGKSRLLEEFLARRDGSVGWQVAVARCPPYGATLTYWPLRGLLTELVGSTEHAAIVACFLRGGHTEEDAERLGDLVLAPLGIRSEGLIERESIFSAWRLLVEALAKDAPRIVVFEDLHRAGDSLLDLVEHVLHPRTQAPLLLIAISRPELHDRRPSWGGGWRENFTALVLKPLSGSLTAELVDRLGAHFSETTRARVVERSGGNPFFTTELVRSLAERVSGTAASGHDALPDTVHAAVPARLDALTPLGRRLIRAASVVGRAFRPALLAAIADGVDVDDLRATLEDLAARDLVGAAEGDTYTFRRALIRDVAYGTLSRVERIHMHAAVAVWLEEQAGDRLDEFAELLAYHYGEAVLLGRRAAVPIPVPVEPARAGWFLERAGELASLGGAFAEARGHLLRAIEIAPVEERTRLYEKLGDSVGFGDWAIDAYREALALWRADGERDAPAGARLLRKILIMYMRWPGGLTDQPGEQEIVAMRAEARRLAEVAGDEAELWRIKVADLFRPLLRDAITAEEAVGGKEIAQAAAAYFEAHQDCEMFHVALDGHTTIAQFVGDPVDAAAAAGRRLVAPTGTPLDRGDALNMLVWSQVDSGAYDQSIEVVHRALAERRPGEPRIAFSHGVAAAALAACLAGRWDDVQDLVAGLMETWEELRQGVGGGLLLAGFFAALHVAGARQDRAATDRAAAVVERILSVERGAYLRPLLGAYLANNPGRLHVDPTHAFWQRNATNGSWELGFMFLSERGVVLPQPVLDDPTTAARTRGVVAAVQALQVNRVLAARDTARLGRVIEDLEAQGLIPHAARMRIVLAERTSDAAPLAHARAVLERLGDRQFLHRLEEVAAVL